MFPLLTFGALFLFGSPSKPTSNIHLYRNRRSCVGYTFGFDGCHNLGCIKDRFQCLFQTTYGHLVQHYLRDKLIQSNAILAKEC